MMGAFARSLLARPRLLASLLIGGLAWVGFGYALPPPLRPLSAWNASGGLYLVLTWSMMLGASREAIERRAKALDESRWVILIILIVACLISLAAIVGLLREAKAGDTGAAAPALAGLTIVISWLLTHSIFALHYAHEFYRHTGAKARRNPCLLFPGEEAPDYSDFLYFSFVIGMTCQVSDVQIASRAMRRLCLFHGILAFFFNTGVLALSINIAAGLL